MPTAARTSNGRAGRRMVALGEEKYLWLLVAIEVGALAWLRVAFRRHHGG